MIEDLRRLFPDARLNRERRWLAGDALVDFMTGFDAAIIGTEKIDRAILDRLPELKVIAKYGVGLDNVDQDLLHQKKIVLGWTGGVNRRSVAELALAGMLGLAHNVFRTGYQLKQGGWNKNGGFLLSEKTVGVVGCGFVGTELLELLRPFHCHLLINDIVDKSAVAKDFGATMATLPELLERSDFVSLHVPLTESTKNFISTPQFARMKPTAYLINTARGEVVDQPALKKALIQGDIAGACLDVFAVEPPTDREFLALENLMVTPHIGGNTAEAVRAMGAAAIQNLLNGLGAAGFNII